MMQDSPYHTRYQLLEGSSYSGGPGSALDIPDVAVAPDGGQNSCQESHFSSGAGPFLHTVPERTRHWNHIDDLDSFFRRVYRFHQSQGYVVMLLQEVCDIMQYLFVVFLTVFCLCGLNYRLLLGAEAVHSISNDTLEVVKVTLADGVYSFSETMSRVHSGVALLLLVAALFLIGKIGYALHNAFQYWETREFFNHALKIPDSELQNVTWDEVKKQLMKLQLQQRMCVHKDILTSLDIYQRILRHQNYMVALVNQNVIPVRFSIPFYGEIIYLTKGYEFNLNLLLFWGSHALLQNTNVDLLRQPHSKKEIIHSLEKKIVYLSLLNLLLLPFIFVYQILYALYHNVERVKNEPGSLAGRCWSHYGRVYLRHYNELEHELAARLNRAYRPAMAYLASFSSPALATVASTVRFMASAIFAVVVIISMYDDDFIRVENVLTLLGATGLIVVVAQACIPDENLVWVPELLMNRIVTQIHYLPESWNNRLHTTQVREEFSQMFQFKFVHILEELVSPIIIPFILFFSLRHRVKEIVDFFHMFTVQVEGIGNVCSFAQMDIQQHGSPAWQPPAPQRRKDDQPPASPSPPAAPNNYAPDGGRTELSLLHFAVTNPDWQPPKPGADFLTALRERTHGDGAAAPSLSTVPESHLAHSMNSLNLTTLEKVQPWSNPVVASGMPEDARYHLLQQQQSLICESQYTVRGCNGSVTRIEGPLHSSVTSGQDVSLHYQQHSSIGGFVGSIHPCLQDPHSPYSPQLHQPQTQNVYDMSISCLYLRGLCNQRRAHKQYFESPSSALPPLRHLPGADYGSTADADLEALPRRPVDEGGYSAEGRLCPRTPSPPPGDPFRDAMMSHLGGLSVRSDGVTSQYQDLLHGASSVLRHQHDGHGGDTTPLVRPSQR